MSSPMTRKPLKRELRLNFAPIGAGGMIPIHHSMKIIQASFREWDHQSPLLPHSRELYIKKKKVQSESDSDDPNSTQQVVYRMGQPTATPILLYEDSRREVVQQCIANLMSTFHLYPHSEVIASSFTERFEDMLRWLYKLIKPTVIAANTGEDGAVKSSLNISVSCIRNCQMRLTSVTWR